jgi:hypothetical protein
VRRAEPERQDAGAEQDAAAAPPVAAPEPPLAAPPTSARQVLAMQRGAGNQAVAAMVSPSGPRLARFPTNVDLERDFQSHLNGRPPDLDQAARDLNGFTDDEIREHVRDLAPDQLEPVKQAAERTLGFGAFRILGPLVDRQLKLAIQRRDWTRAGAVLNSFGPDRIGKVLEGMDPEDLRNLDEDVLKIQYPAISAIAAPIRTAGEPRRLADLDRRYNEALAKRRWADVAQQLDGYDRTGIQKLARAFTSTEDLQAVFSASMDAGYLTVVVAIAEVLGEPPHLERIKKQWLEEEWEAARKARDWRQLGILTARFTFADIPTQLRKLDYSELDPLRNAARAEPWMMLGAVGPIVRRHSEKSLELALFSLGRNDYNVAVLFAKDMDDPETNTFVDGLTPVQLPTITVLVVSTLDDTNRLFRRLNYRGNLPALGAAAHPPSVSGNVANPGDPSVAVPGGGTVTTHLNDTAGSGAFGQDYQGPNAQNTGWIQFMAREAEKFDSDGDSLGYDTSYEYQATGQTEKKRFGSPDDPRWTVDSVGGALPFYDSPTTVAVGTTPVGAAGTSDVGPAQQAMWDNPSARPNVAVPAFKSSWFESDVDKVVIRLKFVQYMIRDQSVVMRGSTTVSWTYASAAAAAPGATGPPRVNTAGPMVPYDHIDALHHAALVSRYPTFRFLAHD